MVTGTSSQDDAALATRPFGPVIPGSNQKIWFEGLVSVASLAAAKGIFVGISNEVSLASKFLISAASGTLASNTIGTTAGGQSFYGFWMHGDTASLGNFDIVWGNDVQAALTAGTAAVPGTIASTATTPASGVVLYSALTAGASNPNPANVNFVPQTAPGVLTATPTTATSPYTTLQQQLLASDPGTNPQVNLPNNVTTAVEFVKLGLRFDGQQTMYFYVNGIQVAKLTISSLMDVTNDFGGVIQIMAGTAAANTLNVGFMRTAALLVP